jgi:U4/U6.U5 tri-snRNP-associated protein 1
LFKNYKPDINIVYYDEYGRALTPRLMNTRTGSKSNGRLVRSWICSRTTSLTSTLFIMMSNGHSLTPKEAWKALSHKFHGKGSGKMKTEKRLKKIAEEKKQEAMASGDTPVRACDSVSYIGQL